MKKKDKQSRILYLMHVPWGWIKQRPHFIAEYLSEEFSVTVCFKKAYNKKTLVADASIKSIELRELIVLPYQRFEIIEKINNHIVQHQLKRIIKEYDIVWVTHPGWFLVIKSILPDDAFLVYDCMDDVIEFPNIKDKQHLQRNVYLSERDLMLRSDIVFASSQNLKDVLMNRYGLLKNMVVINNAIHLESFENHEEVPSTYIERELDKLAQKKLMYIGTISDWMDKDLIVRSVNEHPNIVYIFIGPLESALPKHERIISFPPLDHKYLPALLKKADALIMPFKVSGLIKSVNPVKIYEYIYSGRPVISVGYDETQKFNEYIYTYQDYVEYDKLMSRVVQNTLTPKKSFEDCIAFVKNHTWRKRTDTIIGSIQQSYPRKEIQCSSTVG